MKRFTLIQALQHIGKLFDDKHITDIGYCDDTGLKFEIEHNETIYHISLSDTGIVNSIIKLES